MSKNNVSKPNGIEIISLLYFLLATQISYRPLQVVAIVLGALNMLESMLWAWHFSPNRKPAPTSEDK